MEETVDIVRVLRAIELVEKKLASVYEALSDRYKETRELSIFFGNMKLDEDANLEFVKMQKRIVSRNPFSFRGGIKFDIHAMDSKITAMDELLTATSMPIDEVLRSLYKIERESAGFYTITALSQAAPEMQSFLSSFAYSFQSHFTDLIEFARIHGLQAGKPEDEELRLLRIPFDAVIKTEDGRSFRSVDLSEGGVFLKTTPPLKTGIKVTLEIPISGNTVKINALVVYVRKDVGMGLMFTDMNSDNMKAIQSFVKSITKDIIDKERRLKSIDNKPKDASSETSDSFFIESPSLRRNN